MHFSLIAKFINRDGLSATCFYAEEILHYRIVSNLPLVVFP